MFIRGTPWIPSSVSRDDRVDLIVRASRVLTMSEDGLIEDGCVAVSGGLVKYVGRADSCPHRSENTLDLRRHLLMPGLVDAHAYTYLLAAGRSSASSAVLAGFRPSADALYWSALFAYTTMLLSGVTSVRDSAHDPAVLERAAQRSGIRVIASELLGPGELPSSRASEITVRLGGEQSHISPPESGARMALDASDVDPPLRVESMRSASMVVGASVPSGVAAALRDAGIGLVVTPSQALRGRWAGGISMMSSMGIRAALGTGIRSLYAPPNLLDEARIALHMDAAGGFKPDPNSIIESMTSNAGAVLGKGIGRIAPGLRADMAALDLRRPHLRFPSGDISSALVFSATRGDFDYVVVGGDIVVEEGRHRWLYLEGLARKLESVLESAEL